MNIEQAIKTAIEYEIRVRETYLDALVETSDPVGKRVYRLLADEEHSHVIYLEAKLAAWVARQQLLLDDLDSALPPIELIAQEILKLETTIDKEDGGKEIELLEKARQIEQETSDFYQKLVHELPDHGKKFFVRFLEIEKGHLALVQAEIDSLRGTGFWFDMPEFRPEAG